MPVGSLTAAFDEALFRALAAAGRVSLYDLPILDVDTCLAAMGFAELWALGAHLTEAAPPRIAGYTRFHCFAMCVADRLEAFGVVLR